ncbi:MAG TPA: SDR family oxidoreductase [Blastocatellia bacterium]|nr:SDR family oxidoreductase [Blastocatellia bacterium]
MAKGIYLVTGGAGFIGSHICDRLVRDGQRVRVLDNFSTGKEENLKAISGYVDVVRADLRDLAVVRSAMEGVETVFHQGAMGSVPKSIVNPLAAHEINITGTLNVLLAARDAGIRRVVYASSSSVYGETPVLPKEEDMRPQPLSPYALSKLSAEQYCMVFSQVYGLETVALRYFNIFGPRQDPTSDYAAVVPKFVTSLLQGRAPVIYGDGLQSRDFTYIDNVVEANLLASEASAASGHYVNIACGGRYNLLELLGTIKEITGSQLDPVHEPSRAGDVRDSQASIEAARAILGYKVIVDFREGVRRTVDWYRAHAS